MKQTCKRCDVSKSAGDFYFADRTCKECRKAMVRENYRKNRKHYQEYEKKRMKLLHRKSLAKRVLKSWRERFPDRDKQIAKAWRERNKEKYLAYRKSDPLKYAARTAVGNAVKNGKLIPLPCAACGSKEKTHAHHEDYTKPLDVVWLCRACHSKVHNPNPIPIDIGPPRKKKA